MASTPGDSPLLADSDVDALAWQFLNSAYADNSGTPIGRWISASTAFSVVGDLSVSLKTGMHMTSSSTVSWPTSALASRPVRNSQTTDDHR